MILSVSAVRKNLYVCSGVKQVLSVSRHGGNDSANLCIMMWRMYDVMYVCMYVCIYVCMYEKWCVLPAGALISGAFRPYTDTSELLTTLFVSSSM